MLLLFMLIQVLVRVLFQNKQFNQYHCLLSFHTVFAPLMQSSPQVLTMALLGYGTFYDVMRRKSYEVQIFEHKN